MLSDGYTYNNIDKSAYDAATKQVAEYYREPYINQHEHPFYASSAYKNLTKGHPRAQGYSVMAKAIKQLIEECMSKSEYLDYFNDIYVVN
jgi:lysophospholipase L1-like esterase